MTTKAAPPVEPSAADTLEKIAYESVAAVQTVEPNDRNRLGYHVWRWLTTRQGSLEDTIRESGVTAHHTARNRRKIDPRLPRIEGHYHPLNGAARLRDLPAATEPLPPAT